MTYLIQFLLLDNLKKNIIKHKTILHYNVIETVRMRIDLEPFIFSQTLN